MAGHSKWANIKRRKASQDAHKNKARTRLIREVIVAVQTGGETSARLQMAVHNAKKANVPKQKIEEAIKRASGENGTNYEEIQYQAYGPHGVALIIETMTDNSRRTVAAVRSVLTRYGGKLAAPNALAHLFDRKGVFAILKAEVSDSDTFSLALIESGVDELEEDDTYLHATCPLQDFHTVQEAVKAEGIEPEEVSISYMPTVMTEVTEKEAERVSSLIEALEAEDDVQRVYDTMKVSDT